MAPLKPFGRPPLGGVLRPVRPGGVVRPGISQVGPSEAQLVQIQELQQRLAAIRVQQGFSPTVEVRRLELELLALQHPERVGTTLGPEGIFSGGKLSEPTVRVTNDLALAAQKAVAQPTFDERNRVGAEGVAKQAAAFTTAAIDGNPTVEAAIRDVFRTTALKVGELLRVGFQADGLRANALMQGDFNAGLRAGQQTALNDMPKLLAAIDGAWGTSVRTEPEYAATVKDVLNRTRLDDVKVLVEKQLGVQSASTGDQLKQQLGIIVPEEDARQANLAGFPVRQPNESALTPSELQIVTLKNRFEHMVKQTQAIHAAAYTGDTTHVDPMAARGTFAPYDVQKNKLYASNQLNDPGGRAFALAVYDTAKDTWPKP